MAHPRDWRRTESSRNYGGNYPYRNIEQEQRRFGRGGERWDEDEFGPRSAEGIGDYGGYSAEESSDRGEFAPTSRDELSSHNAPRSGRDEWREAQDYRRHRSGREYGRGEYRDYVGAGNLGSGGTSNYGRDYGAEDYGSRESFRNRPNEPWGNERYTRYAQEQHRGYRSYDSGGDDYGRSTYGQRNLDADLRNERFGGSEYGSSWERQQSHRGKGPKGYERSDDRLKEVISEKLSDDHYIDATEITVSVSGGVVRLTGTVGSRADKYYVEELIERCGGVKDIDNQLRANPQSGQSQWNTGTGSQSSGQGSGQSSSYGAGTGSSVSSSSSDLTSGSGARRTEGGNGPGKKQ